MVTIVSVKNQFGDHEDRNFNEGLRRSQKASGEGANRSSKGCDTKEWGEGRVKKTEKKNVKREKKIFEILFNHVFCQKKVLHLVELESQLRST